jgi:hypothetical protein
MILSKIYIKKTKFVKKKIFTFSRKRKDRSVLKTHFNKFLNFLMRQDLKINLFLFFIA